MDSLNGTVSGASSGRGERWKIKDALLARERVEQVDDFAGLGLGGGKDLKQV